MSGLVEQLFDEYAAAHARGERPDVSGYLDRASADREGLGRLIDAYLQAAPVQPPDEETLQLIRARLAGTEPPLLIERRKRGLKFQTVVDALRARLELPLEADARLGSRYHDLEVGLLDTSRIDSRIWETLGELLGRDVRSLVSPAKPTLAAAYLRSADAPTAVSPRSRADARPEELEVDRLFGVAE